MVTDTILRNTILEEKFRAALMKTEKISEKESIKRLEELTPLAMIVLNAKPKPKVASDDEEIEEIDDANVEALDGAKPGPIDVDYKSKMKQSPSFEAETGHEIKTWVELELKMELWGYGGNLYQLILIFVLQMVLASVSYTHLTLPTICSV